MTRKATKAAAPATPPRTEPKTCGYPDGKQAVAVRQTPRGPRYLCEAHAASTRALGIDVEDL